MFFALGISEREKMSVGESDSAKIVQYLAKDAFATTQKTNEHQIA